MPTHGMTFSYVEPIFLMRQFGLGDDGRTGTSSMRPLKWTAVTLGALACIYVVWGAFFLIGFFYASSKFEQITVEDTQSSIEAKKGLLVSREVSREYLGGYQFVFEELVSDPNNTKIAYGLFGAGFTVIYGSEGKVLARIDNGLDG